MNSINNSIHATDQCIGHRIFIKNCKSDGELKKSAANQEALFLEKPEIERVETDGVNKIIKKGLFRKKKLTHDLFVTYYHKADSTECNYLNTKDVKVVDTKNEPSVQAESIAAKSVVESTTDNSIEQQQKLMDELHQELKETIPVSDPKFESVTPTPATTISQTFSDFLTSFSTSQEELEFEL